MQTHVVDFNPRHVLTAGNFRSAKGGVPPTTPRAMVFSLGYKRLTQYFDIQLYLTYPLAKMRLKDVQRLELPPSADMHVHLRQDKVKSHVRIYLD